MGRLWLEINAWPFSSCIVAVCVGVWIFQWNSRADSGSVAFSYRHVVLNRQIWRIVTAMVSHGSFLHLAFNMAMVWQQGHLELQFGSLEFLRVTFLLATLSPLFMLAISWVLIYRLRLVDLIDQGCVGYSAILFGWLAIESLANPFATILFMDLIPCPAVMAPPLALLITHVIVRNASLTGHISGIVAGYLVGSGAFFWFTNYLFLCTAIWSGIVVILSAKLTTDIPMPFLKFVDRPPGQIVIRVARSPRRSPTRASSINNV